MNSKEIQRKIIIGCLIILAVGIILFSILDQEYPTTKTTNINDITYFNKDETMNWNQYKVNKLELNDSFTITSEGVYHISGNITDGTITINSSGPVKLIVDNLTISNSIGPAINIQKAKFCVIESIGENKLSDGSNEREEDAVIYSKDDLVLSGEGKLIIQANSNDGIVSKDDLKVTGGTYEITSLDDGIRGKDQIYITNGIFNIQCNGDALKSDNDEKGDIYITNGTFSLQTSTQEDKSAKGMKAYRSIIIDNGTFSINSDDDSIHTNGDITINNGTFTISSKDDAIHADNSIVINQGTINIETCYEGLEAETITINNGDIQMNCLDDGINCASKNSNELPNTPSKQLMTNNENIKLTINGGNIYCNTTGDGLDSNGSIEINGGIIIIDGPEKGDNSALDSDGECVINGGEVIALGAAGMLEIPSEHSSINMIIVEITNAKHIDIQGIEELCNIDLIKNYQVMIYASSKLENNQEYTIRIDDTTSTCTIHSTITQIGELNLFNGLHGGMNPRPEGNMNPPASNEFSHGNPDHQFQGGNEFSTNGRPEGMEPPANGERPQRPNKFERQA